MAIGSLTGMGLSSLGQKVIAQAGNPQVMAALAKLASQHNANMAKSNEATTPMPSGPSGGAQLPPGATALPGGGYYSPIGYTPPTFIPGGPSMGGTQFVPSTSGYGVPELINAGVGAIGGCDAMPTPLKEICKGYGILTGGPKPTTTAQTGTGLQQATCPPGTVRVGNTCVSPGDLFPGGAPGMFEAGGQAVAGGFGMPAFSPTIVGSVANNRGEVRPIRRCPRGMVLGFDELCYPKAVLPRRSRFRKHKGERKPPMTGADAAALRRIGSLKNRVKELASDAGLTCANRSSRRKK